MWAAIPPIGVRPLPIPRNRIPAPRARAWRAGRRRSPVVAAPTSVAQLGPRFPSLQPRAQSLGDQALAGGRRIRLVFAALVLDAQGLDPGGLSRLEGRHGTRQVAHGSGEFDAVL